MDQNQNLVLVQQEIRHIIRSSKFNENTQIINLLTKYSKRTRRAQVYMLMMKIQEVLELLNHEEITTALDKTI